MQSKYEYKYGRVCWYDNEVIKNQYPNKPEEEYNFWKGDRYEVVDKEEQDRRDKESMRLQKEEDEERREYDNEDYFMNRPPMECDEKEDEFIMAWIRDYTEEYEQ